MVISPVMGGWGWWLRFCWASTSLIESYSLCDQTQRILPLWTAPSLPLDLIPSLLGLPSLPCRHLPCAQHKLSSTAWPCDETLGTTTQNCPVLSRSHIRSTDLHLCLFLPFHPSCLKHHLCSHPVCPAVPGTLKSLSWPLGLCPSFLCAKPRAFHCWKPSTPFPNLLCGPETLSFPPVHHSPTSAQQVTQGPMVTPTPSTRRGLGPAGAQA